MSVQSRGCRRRTEYSPLARVAALLVPAHALTLLVLRRTRSAVAGFAVAAVAGIVLASPVVALTVSQQGQIAWIGNVSPNYLSSVVLEQWFNGSRLFTVVAAVIVIVGGIALMRTPRAIGPSSVLAVALPWILVPTTLVVGYSIFVDEIYQPRYLTFTAPGLALLLGVCVTAIFQEQNRATIAVLGVLTLAAMPAFLAQRDAYAKPAGADYSAIANVVGAHAHAGDCVAFDPYAPWTPGPLRAVAAVRPDAFSGLVDVAAGIPGAASAQLWTEDLPLSGDAQTLRLDACPALWFVTSQDYRSPELDYVEARGWVVKQTWDLNRSAVLLLTRL